MNRFFIGGNWSFIFGSLSQLLHQVTFTITAQFRLFLIFTEFFYNVIVI